MSKFKPGDPFAGVPNSEPQIAIPIEDQILEAIVSTFFPPASELPTSPFPPPPCAVSPLSLAAQLKLPLSKVLDILASPRTRSQLAAAQELRDLEFHQREQRARDKALTALESILDTTEDPIEKRRAATAILGRRSNRNPFWPRTPGGAGGTATLRVASSLDDDLDEDNDEDASPPRAPLPSPEHPKWCRPPQKTLIHLLTRLQDNHNPEPNAGLATLFLHKQETNKLAPAVQREALADYLEDPGEDTNLANFSAAILHTPEPDPNLPPAWVGREAHPPGHTRTHHITLHWPDHHRTIQVHLTNAGNGIADFWQIASIDIGPADSHDSS